ncbi:hypothetical protein JUN65_04680 [Gluconacetobacter azotocaptans]|uniref:hypothetical protein n=1 Tax=Gluconacetobacter azotocaptans TaxID=142834 RepID=UPI00195E843A|nr:hypothetical protein [Gluconacetobacter azotocaptans]MBM9400878.1 hypothetical protein [Gluconacetobacter azotocaptans]
MTCSVVLTAVTERERRIALLLGRAPDRLRRAVAWLRVPSRRHWRLLSGGLLILGGFLFILPFLGLWMLPLGLLLLSEDIAVLRRGVDRGLVYIEQNHPGWMGLPNQK